MEQLVEQGLITAGQAADTLLEYFAPGSSSLF